MVFGQEVNAGFSFKTVVIDAGHGGKDPGAHGAYSSEKNVALAIAKKVELLLREEMPGINVIMTRSTDRFVELKRRAGIANENHANLFVSIHCNSSPDGTGASNKGVMLLVYGFHRKEEQMEALRENASIYIEKDYQKNYDGYSENDPTALIVLNTVMQKYRKQSYPVWRNSKQGICEYRWPAQPRGEGAGRVGFGPIAPCPQFWLETGYINNPTEEAYLEFSKRAGRDRCIHCTCYIALSQ